MAVPTGHFGEDRQPGDKSGNVEYHDKVDHSTPHHSALAALADLETPDVDFRWDRTVWCSLAAVYLAWTVTTFASATSSSSLAYVAMHFPAYADRVAWVSTAPYLVATILLVPCGELSDLLGRKMLVCLCLVAGMVGTIITGTASTFGAAVAGQAVSGGALVLAYLPAPLVQEMVPKVSRPIVAGAGGCIVGAAFIIAPLAEGACIKAAYGGPLEGWRVGYYISAGLYGIAAIVVFFLYSPAPRPNPTHSSALGRLLKLDWVGTFLLAAGLSLFLIGLSGGGVLFPWASAATISMIVIGAVCIIGLIVWCWKGTSEGIFLHCLFTHRNFAISLVVRGVGTFAQIGCQAFLPQLIVLVFTSDGILQAVWQLPFTVSLIFGALLAAIGMRVTREIRWLAVLSMLLIALGSGLLSIVKPNINFAGFFFPCALIGLGIGMEAQIMYVVAGLCTPDHLIGTALMVASLSGTFSGAVGIVIFGTIYTAEITKNFPKFVAEAVLTAGLPPQDLVPLLEAYATRNPATIESSPGVTPAILGALNAGAKSAYAYSFHNVWYALLGFAIITAIISCFIGKTKDQMTEKVAAPVGKLAHGQLDQVDEKKG